VNELLGEQAEGAPKALLSPVVVHEHVRRPVAIAVAVVVVAGGRRRRRLAAGAGCVGPRRPLGAVELLLLLRLRRRMRKDGRSKGRLCRAVLLLRRIKRMLLPRRGAVVVDVDVDGGQMIRRICLQVDGPVLLAIRRLLLLLV
jgi:hypothetical protein